MAKETEIKYKCDICGRKYDEKEYSEQNNPYDEKIKIRRVSGFPVLFTTEQNEGRSCKPYITFENMDVCNKCLFALVRVKGWGAQGFKNYELMNDGYHPND